VSWIRLVHLYSIPAKAGIRRVGWVERSVGRIMARLLTEPPFSALPPAPPIGAHQASRPPPPAIQRGQVAGRPPVQRFDVNQPPRARIVEWSGAAVSRSRPTKVRTASESAARHAPLGVEPFEVSDQQQAEVPPRRQAGSSHHWRVELPTLLLREPVEPSAVEDSVQARVEGMARRNRQIGGRHPHRSLLARAFAHRHGPHCTLIPSLLTRDFSPTLTTGC
jgi:hypothetical protein